MPVSVQIVKVTEQMRAGFGQNVRESLLRVMSANAELGRRGYGEHVHPVPACVTG